jgi:phosphoribosylanthranilate isomerase
MLLKVCGVHGPSAERDIAMLAATGVDLVGLWHGVPGGDADLEESELVRLAAVAREHGVEPVLVTFDGDPVRLARALRKSGVRWVQLHAYQLPTVVTALRTATHGARVTIVKVLHVRGGRCVDVHLVPGYERAGVDAFLIDAATDDGRVGSTGAQVPPDVAAETAARLARPFLLAGGLSGGSREDYDEIVRDDGFVGIDVSTGARDERGRLRAARVEAINRAWRGAPLETHV